MGKIDLHIHTTASDGKFKPAEMVRKAWENGLTHIAITDHDSINGVIPAQEAAKSYPGMTVIAGVEINTDNAAGELHILGYFLDCSNEELISTLERLRNSRIERAKGMIARLQNLGVNIDYQRVRALAGTGSVGRPHIAQAMLEKNYISTFKEAFIKYIGHGGPAYVERDKITSAGATQLVLRAKGVPVLAHPFTCENPESVIGELKTSGLMGLEVYYGSYSPEQVEELRRIADKYDLVPTGGSDFHGLDVLAESQLGSVEVPVESIERLMTLERKKD